MELLLISDSKLKITLDKGDMKFYSIDCSTLDYDNTETRKAFWNILDEAKHKTGFDAASQKVFIQLYPSKEGGCEMYVTKLGVLSSPGKTDCEIVSRSEDEPIEKIYSFPDLRDLTRVCALLEANGFSGESRAWKMKERYYLVIFESGICAYMPLNEFVFINEFGDAESVRATSMLLSEHGVEICRENAVHILSSL